jgi:hypothetical protein
MTVVPFLQLVRMSVVMREAFSAQVGELREKSCSVAASSY